MSIKDDIKNLLDNSYELSRAEIAKKLGIDREQVRKPLTKLLEAKEIERRVEDGVEWFTIAGTAQREKEWEEYQPSSFERGIEIQFERATQSVESSLGRQVEEGLREIEDFSMERWNRGYKAGYEAAWDDIGEAIVKALRKVLEIQPIEEQLDD